jgi:hypothetical protein
LHEYEITLGADRFRIGRLRMIACFIGVNVGSGHSASLQAITRDK